MRDTLWLWALFAVLCLSSVLCDDHNVEGMTWTYEEMPNPWTDANRCNRPYPSQICDPSGILEIDEANDLDRVLGRIVNDTRCGSQSCFGCLPLNTKKSFTVNLALIPYMARAVNASNSSQALLGDARYFAYALSEYWKRDECQTTVVVLYIARMNVLYTITQSNAREILTDDLVVRITVQNQRRMNEGAGVKATLKQLLLDYKNVFEGKYKS